MATVLDLGCGNGLMQKRLRQYRPDLEFISVDKYDFSKEFPFGTFFNVDISKEVLPIKSGIIDAVFCSHVFEHLYSHDLILSEIRRVLKPTGKIYIEVPSTRTLYLPSLGLFQGQDAPINFYDDPTHLRPFTRQSLHIIGKKLGFRKIRTGLARNWLYCLLAPLILPYSIIKKDRQMFATILWNITGWCAYLWGEDIDK
jgi:ubiquinone/menaquinone biosynthesis C-methylase UbiE